MLEYPVIFVDFCKIVHTMKKLIFSQNVSLPLLFPSFFDFIVANKTFRLEESILKVSAPKTEKIFVKKCPTRKNDPVYRTDKPCQSLEIVPKN